MKYKKLLISIVSIFLVSAVILKGDRLKNKFKSIYTQYEIKLFQYLNVDNYADNRLDIKKISLDNFPKNNFEREYFIIDAWGDKGFGEDQFIQPYGTMVNDDNFFVSDCRKGKIMVFNTNNKKLVKTYGKGWGKEPGYLDYPADIALNKISTDSINNKTFKSDKIFVVEEKTNRISVFDLSSGKFLYEYGNRGSDVGQFNNPLGLEIDYENNIYVVDYGNHRIQKFDKDFNFIYEIGGYGSEKGKFNGPYYMTIDYDNNIYVVDRGNNRVQVFDKYGQFKFMFGEKGSENGKFDYPHEITFSNDHLFVADFNNHRIQIFESNGKYLNSIGEKFNLAGPKTVAVNEIGEIFITDLYASFKYVTKWGTEKEKKIDEYDFYRSSDQFYFPEKLESLNGFPFSKNKDYKELSYAPDFPFFSNYTVKDRRVYMPRGSDIDLEALKFPENTVIQKDFIQNTDCKIIESRFMVFKNSKWNYASYVNQNGKFNINLSPTHILVEDSKKGEFDYYVPGLNNCYDCHKNNKNETLGFTSTGLNNDFHYLKNYIKTKKYDETKFSDLTMELKSNCAYCHNDVTVFSHFEEDFKKNILRVSPVSQDTLVVPNNIKNSKIYSVIEKNQMPPYGLFFKNEELLFKLEKYINEL